MKVFTLCDIDESLSENFICDKALDAYDKGVIE